MERTHPWQGLAPALALALCASGCLNVSDEYTIRMQPVSGGLERRITARVVRADQSRMYPRLMAAYHLPTWRDTVRFEGRAVCRDTLPDDVGGRGRVAHRVSPLGESWLYVESFRGDPDPAGRIERRLAIADSATTLLFGWLRHERPDDPRLSFAAETRVRTALGALAVQTWRSPPTTDLADIYALSLTAETLSWPIRGRRPTSDDWLPDPPDLTDATSLARLVLGVGPEGGKVLGYLAGAESLQISLAGYLKTRGDWPTPPTGHELEDLLERAQRLPSVADSLHLELALAVQPYWTNGIWDDSSRVVTWSTYLSNGPDDTQPPFSCGALWTVPDRVHQQQLFGRVVLEAEDLDRYCEMRAELLPARLSEWDRMVETLRPGHTQALDGFRFSDERTRGVEVMNSDAHDLRDLLQSAIASKPEE